MQYCRQWLCLLAVVFLLAAQLEASALAQQACNWPGEELAKGPNSTVSKRLCALEEVAGVACDPILKPTKLGEPVLLPLDKDASKVNPDDSNPTQAGVALPAFTLEEAEGIIASAKPVDVPCGQTFPEELHPVVPKGSEPEAAVLKWVCRITTVFTGPCLGTDLYTYATGFLISPTVLLTSATAIELPLSIETPLLEQGCVTRVRLVLAKCGYHQGKVFGGLSQACTIVRPKGWQDRPSEMRYVQNNLAMLSLKEPIDVPSFGVPVDNDLYGLLCLLGPTCSSCCPERVLPRCCDSSYRTPEEQGRCCFDNSDDLSTAVVGYACCEEDGQAQYFATAQGKYRHYPRGSNGGPTFTWGWIARRQAICNGMTGGPLLQPKSLKAPLKGTDVLGTVGIVVEAGFFRDEPFVVTHAMTKRNEEYLDIGRYVDFLNDLKPQCAPKPQS